MLFSTVWLYSYNTDWTSLCNHNLDDTSNEMAWVYSKVGESIVGMNVSLMGNFVVFYQVKTVTSFSVVD